MKKVGGTPCVRDFRDRKRGRENLSKRAWARGGSGNYNYNSESEVSIAIFSNLKLSQEITNSNQNFTSVFTKCIVDNIWVLL